MTPGNRSVVIELSLVVAALAVAEALLTLVQRYFSARIGEGLIYDLRTQVFAHVLRQPIAFFTRAQTGALVSRLNSDVLGAQQAFTSVLSSVVSNVVSLALIVGAMATLSWQLTLAALALVPALPHPGPGHGPPARRSRARARWGSTPTWARRMTERFNVAGALLVKLFGTPGARGRRVCRAGRQGPRHRRADRAQPQRLLRRPRPRRRRWPRRWSTASAASWPSTARLTVGTLLALAALLARLYGPLTRCPTCGSTS